MQQIQYTELGFTYIHVNRLSETAGRCVNTDTGWYAVWNSFYVTLY